MSRAHTLTADELAVLRRPREDLLVETEAGADRWNQEYGPFAFYERRLQVTSADEAADRFDVTETIESRLAIPVPLWRWIFQRPMANALANLDRRPRSRWWWSRDPVGTTTIELLSVVALLSVVVGYLGVIIGQTITFATDEFGADDSSQGNTLAAVRIGVLLSVVFLRFADRIGRKPLLIWFTALSILLTASGALAPDLTTLGVSQALARGLATGLLTLITLTVAEEVPAESRSFAIGLITMASGFGGGIMVVLLPLADLGARGWRLIYLVPLVTLPAVYWAAKVLPETRRFTAARHHGSGGKVNRKWFVLLAVTAFCSATFLSPASQFMNEYLNDELGRSATWISFFRLIIYSPIGVFIIGAGILADRIGRRPVGAVGIAFGAIASALVFSSQGAMLWLSSMVGAWLLTAAYTALRGYQTELFPTRARARVGGWLDGISVTGSALGLVVAGQLSDHYGRLAPGMAMLLVGPMIVLILLIVAFPETARRELEEFNPDDPDIRNDAAAAPFDREGEAGVSRDREEPPTSSGRPPRSGRRGARPGRGPSGRATAH